MRPRPVNTGPVRSHDGTKTGTGTATSTRDGCSHWARHEHYVAHSTGTGRGLFVTRRCSRCWLATFRCHDARAVEPERGEMPETGKSHEQNLKSSGRFPQLP